MLCEQQCLSQDTSTGGVSCCTEPEQKGRSEEEGKWEWRTDGMSEQKDCLVITQPGREGGRGDCWEVETLWEGGVTWSWIEEQLLLECARDMDPSRNGLVLLDHVKTVESEVTDHWSEDHFFECRSNDWNLISLIWCLIDRVDTWLVKWLPNWLTGICQLAWYSWLEACLTEWKLCSGPFCWPSGWAEQRRWCVKAGCENHHQRKNYVIMWVHLRTHSNTKGQTGRRTQLKRFCPLWLAGCPQLLQTFISVTSTDTRQKIIFLPQVTDSQS